ncbi:MAG TPA: YaeQ family protein [Gemmatimonadaceae bacterium]|nr:YaeQ family protein [Gemmatimonadaceae bacterium]
MALTATIYNFAIELADVDRGVYESLSLKVAQHPSETDERLVTRVLAFCLEHAEGITFSRGISDPDEPAITVRDLTGTITAWIEVGAPDAARLHKASKAAPRVVVYIEKAAVIYLRQLEGARIHRAESIAIRALERDLVAALVERLDRRMTFSLSVTDGHLFLTLPDGTSVDGAVEQHAIPAS